MKNYWGIDLGGTKIEGVGLRYDPDLTILKRIRIPTEAAQGYDHIIRQIARLVKMLEDATGHKIDRIGVGTPGVIDPASLLVKNANTTCLIGRPFLSDLTSALGIPVKMANDANCFAVAEAVEGAARTFPKTRPDEFIVFGVIMGTGVGGGMVINGRALHGRHGIAGEWGHNFLDASGGLCYCGRTGCVETIISGPALERYYSSLTGNEKSLDRIVADADNGEEAAVQTVNRLTGMFGKAMAQVINIVDPDVVVLGGGLSNIPALYSEGIDAIKDHIFNKELKTVFLKPQLGDSAGVIGAALL
jgi:fructokinase